LCLGFSPRSLLVDLTCLALQHALRTSPTSLAATLVSVSTWIGLATSIRTRSKTLNF